MNQQLDSFPIKALLRNNLKPLGASDLSVVTIDLDARLSHCPEFRAAAAALT